MMIRIPVLSSSVPVQSVTPTRAAFRPGRALTARLLAASLVPLLVPATPLFAQIGAQTVAGPQSPIIQTSAPAMLHITILEGEEALNNIRERTAREPIVQIEDQNHKPVAGVAVVFTSLRGTNGAGGTFNNFTSFKTVTNAQGRAVGRGFKPNNLTGQFSIQVQAMAGTLSATAVIHEINSTGGADASSSSSSNAGNATANTTTQTTAGTTATGAGHILHLINLIPKWVVVGAVAGGATAVAVATTPTTNGATISTGTGVVTAPAATRATARR